MIKRAAFGALVAWYACQLVFGGVVHAMRAARARRARELRERDPALH
jgi:hypothetical protein